MFIEYRDEGEPSRDRQLMNLGTCQHIYILELPSYDRFSHAVRVCFSDDNCQNIFKSEETQCQETLRRIKEAVRKGEPIIDISRGHMYMRDHMQEWIKQHCLRDPDNGSLEFLPDMCNFYNQFVEEFHKDWVKKQYPKTGEMDIDTFKTRIEYEGFNVWEGHVVGIIPNLTWRRKLRKSNE